MLLSVELCSLTLQRDDASVANLVATGLFGDGAAAVVLAGGARADGARGPRVVATRSVLYPDTEWVMGWDVVDTGFKVVLSAKVPEVIEARVGGGRGRLPRRARPRARRRPPLDRAHRRAEGDRGVPPRARAPARGARALLALAPRGGEPLLRVGAVRARRLPRRGRRPPRRRRAPRGDGPGLLGRARSSSGGDDDPDARRGRRRPREIVAHRAGGAPARGRAARRRRAARGALDSLALLGSSWRSRTASACPHRRRRGRGAHARGPRRASWRRARPPSTSPPAEGAP